MSTYNFFLWRNDKIIVSLLPNTNLEIASVHLLFYYNKNYIMYLANGCFNLIYFVLVL